jgi:hypothetical protein
MTELRAALERPIDAAWLGALRALLGLTLCVSMLRFIVYGWIDGLFVDPRFHFRYFGFGWLPPLSHAGAHALVWAMALCALLVALGIWFRVSAVLLALGLGYLQLIDVTTYLNHYYLALLLCGLLALSPAQRWGALRASGPAQLPALWLYLFRFQVGVVYTFAGFAKAHADWLLHAQPLSIWLSAHTDMPLLGPLFRLPLTALLMSWAGFLFDVSVPWLLSSRKLRPFAFAAVIVFHALTRALFPIGMFPVIMVVSALVFFPPSWPRRVLALLPWRAPARDETGAPPQRHLPGWALGACALYCALQALWPLRCFAYGGNVRWHEQGMRFSWRVMVREKNGSVNIRVREPRSGRVWYVSPHAYLTRQQEREMAGQPDLVLQLAHHVHDDYARRGYGDVEVRADALVSLNGRRMQRMIDPEVDLAQVPDGLGKADWILPAPAEPPPQLKPL